MQANLTLLYPLKDSPCLVIHPPKPLPLEVETMAIRSSDGILGRLFSDGSPKQCREFRDLAGLSISI